MSPERPALSRRHVLGGAAGLVATSTLGSIAAGGARPAWAGPPPGRIVRGPKVTLVASGRPVAVIVVEEPDAPLVVEAAQSLQRVVAQASGATLPIIGPTDPVPTPAAVRLGRGPKAVAALAEAGITLQQEEFWTKASGRDVLVVGTDADPGTVPNNFVARTPATLWGVQRLLDDWLGVRWLWPGEAGTVVPHSSDIAIGHHEAVRRPALLARQLRNQLTYGHRTATNRWLSDDELATLNAEYFRWAEAHHMGTRQSITAPHSFTTWWSRFGADHPDWFAQPPTGSSYQQPWPEAGRVKLRISNPAVADQIIADWRAAGRPATYAVTPNDSTGFDTSPATMATDFPANQDPLEVWLGRGKLATRYVRFWNSLLERMRAERPDALLLSLAYAAYAEAPPPEAGVQVADGTILGLVPAPWDEAAWSAWSDLGARLYLRPNWWHGGASAPLLPLHQEGGFVAFSRAHNSAGFDFDSVLGFWANQHLRYYLVARLNVRPELSVDAVIAEYLACFGSAATTMGAYVDYWEDFATRASYPLGYPNNGPLDPGGLYAQAVRDHGINPGITKGSIEALAYLYPDSVIEPAREILQQARTDAAGEVEVLARISFLAEGLTELETVRDTLVLGKQDRTGPAFIAKAGELLDLRKELTGRHAVWGEVAYWREQAFNLPTS